MDLPDEILVRIVNACRNPLVRLVDKRFAHAWLHADRHQVRVHRLIDVKGQRIALKTVVHANDSRGIEVVLNHDVSSEMPKRLLLRAFVVLLSNSFFRGARTIMDRISQCDENEFYGYWAAIHGRRDLCALLIEKGLQTWNDVLCGCVRSGMQDLQWAVAHGATALVNPTRDMRNHVVCVLIEAIEYNQADIAKIAVHTLSRYPFIEDDVANAIRDVARVVVFNKRPDVLPILRPLFEVFPSVRDVFTVRVLTYSLECRDITVFNTTMATSLINVNHVIWDDVDCLFAHAASCVGRIDICMRLFDFFEDWMDMYDNCRNKLLQVIMTESLVHGQLDCLKWAINQSDATEKSFVGMQVASIAGFEWLIETGVPMTEIGITDHVYCETSGNWRSLVWYLLTIDEVPLTLLEMSLLFSIKYGDVSLAVCILQKMTVTSAWIEEHAVEFDMARDMGFDDVIEVVTASLTQ